MDTPDSAETTVKPKRDKKKMLTMVIIVLLLLALAGLGYLYWQKTNQLEKEVSDKQAKISLLEADNAALKAQPTTQTDSSGFLEIPEWGVKLKVGTDLSDLVYFVTVDKQFAYFSTRSLMALEYSKEIGSTKCSPASGAIGAISRGKAGDTSLMEGETPIDKSPTAKKIGDYYYDESGPQANCSEDKAVVDLQTSQIKLLKQVAQSIQSQ